MKPKKKFKETTVGKLLLGAVSIVSPPLGNIIEGLSTPQEAIEAITQSKISVEDKIKLQTLIYDQQNKEMEAITSRWKAAADVYPVNELSKELNFKTVPTFVIFKDGKPVSVIKSVQTPKTYIQALQNQF